MMTRTETVAASRPLSYREFERAHRGVIRLCGRLPVGHRARAELFRMGGSPRGIQTLADLLAIVCLIHGR